MYGDFDSIFNENEETTKIPQDIVSAINSLSDLPEGYEYKEHGSRCILETTKNNNIAYKANLVLTKDMFEMLKNVNEEERSSYILEYLYRTQQGVYVKNLNVVINGKEYSFEKSPYVNNDLKKQNSIFIRPQPFLPPKDVNISIIDGKEFKIKFQRQPYESMDTMLFSNVSFKLLDIKLYFHEADISKDKFDVNFKITLNFEYAESVEQLIDALNLYKAFMTSNVRVNNEKLPKVDNAVYDDKWLESGLLIWTKVRKIEEVLGVKFNPSVDLDKYNYNLLLDLYDSLIDDKVININGEITSLNIKPKKGVDAKEFINKTAKSIELVGDNNFEALGAKFEVFSCTSISEFIITSTEPLDDDLIKLNIEPVKGKGMKIKRKYFKTKEEAENYTKQLQS